MEEYNDNYEENYEEEYGDYEGEGYGEEGGDEGYGEGDGEEGDGYMDHDGYGGSFAVSTEPVDQQAQKRVLQTAIKHATSKGYMAGYDTTSEHQWAVHVSFRVDEIDEDLLAACGIDKEKFIYVQFIFKSSNPSYLCSRPLLEKKEFEIKQTTSTNLNVHKLDNSFEFGLGYTLQQRLTAWFDKQWDHYYNTKKENYRLVYLWMEQENIPHAEAVMAALSMPQEDIEIAKAALKECKNDVSLAINFLAEHEDRDGFEAAVRTATKDKKPFSIPEDTFLTDVVNYLKSYIIDAPKYCICCGQEQPMALLKPVTCDRELCQFQQINLGLGVSLEAELLHRSSSVDLLICMTVSSATENRHFIPFPTIQVSHLNKSNERETLTFDKSKPQEVIDLLQKCPGVDELNVWVKEGCFREKCDAISPLLYPLLRWIVATNRAHLKKLDSNLEMGTEYQFILKSTTPEREQIFQQAKREHESIFAWHGSPLGNWHSILRVGLKNYSDTVHQRNGRVYGPGIYLAVDVGTSLGYAAGYSTWKNSKFGSSLKCVALCEVINYGSNDKCLGRVHRPKCSHCVGAPFYRVEAEEFVITRFLFIYSGSGSFNKNANDLAASIRENKEYSGQKSDI